MLPVPIMFRQRSCYLTMNYEELSSPVLMALWHHLNLNLCQKPLLGSQRALVSPLWMNSWMNHLQCHQLLWLILGDTIVLKTLSNKFAELPCASRAESPCLPKISVTKLFNDTASEVNACISVCWVILRLRCCSVCIYCMLRQLLFLTYCISHSPVVSTLKDLRLEMTIRDLRRDLSLLVAGGFPPCGSPRFLYQLSGLYCKYDITSVCSFQVAIETLKKKITSYAACRAEKI